MIHGRRATLKGNRWDRPKGLSHAVRKPGWRNGIRGSLKNCWPQGLESSNLSLGTLYFGIIRSVIEKLSPRETLLSKRFDLIMIMGSPLELSNGIHYYPLFNPEDPNLKHNVDGDLKAQAVRQIYLNNMARRVLVTGGIQDGTSRAEALVRHTNARYEVPLDFMIPLTSLPHSMGNLQKTIEYLKTLPEQFSGDLGISTISAHIRRSAEMAEELELAKLISGRVQFLSVEVMLQAAGILTVDQAKRYYSTENMRQRIIEEDQGVRDLRAHNYAPRS